MSLHALQRLAHLAAVGGPEREVFDGVEAIANRLQRHQRPEQPRAQQAGAHRRDGAVDLLQQRARAPALGRFHEFEVLDRQRVDDQPVGVLLER